MTRMVKQNDSSPVPKIIVPTGDAPSLAFLANLAFAEIHGFAVEVTPDLARQWLRTNEGNRPLRRNHVGTLSAAMNAGHWKLTHQGIAFSEHGRLIDGQHRLEAIIASGKPADLVVYIDLDDDMFGALDRGIRRNHADDLRKDRRLVDPCSWIARMLHGADTVPPNTHEVADILDLYQKEAATVHETIPGRGKGRTPAGFKAALMVRLHDATSHQRTLLLTQARALYTLDLTALDDTAQALYRRLANLRGSGGGVLEEHGAIAWIGFNPRERNLKKVIVRDVATELEEMRAAVDRHKRDRAERRVAPARLS
jgi:hypothetical protein